MHDYTIHIFYQCSNAPTEQMTKEEREILGLKTCDWFDFTHSEKAIETDKGKVCPLCGQPVRAMRMAV